MLFMSALCLNTAGKYFVRGQLFVERSVDIPWLYCIRRILLESFETFSGHWYDSQTSDQKVVKKDLVFNK